jgi:hypothetical protein
MVAVQNLEEEIVTIFLHAYLQVVYYNCVKFHKNPISRLGGVVLTRYMTPPFRESINVWRDGLVSATPPKWLIGIK